MSQSQLTAALLFAMFILFVAARGRLPVYTDVLWGGGGKGGGTVDPKADDKSKGVTIFDPEGDGFDFGDAMRVFGTVAPWPFDIPFKFAEPN